MTQRGIFWRQKTERSPIRSFIRGVPVLSLRLPWECSCGDGYRWQHYRYDLVRCIRQCDRAYRRESADIWVQRAVWGADGSQRTIVLLYMRTKFYNSALKRFMKADILEESIADSSTLNVFTYVNGNPISFGSLGSVCWEGESSRT